MMTRRSIQRRRLLAAVLAALIVPVAGGPASALGVPADTQYPRPVPETGALTPSDFSGPGDTKFDSPGASRAPRSDASRTIQFVRPQRTIVRDTDPVLPIALSGAALLVALGLAGTVLIRMRSLRLG